MHPIDPSGIRAPEESLDAIGVRHGIDQSSSGHDYLSIYQRHVGSLRGEAGIDIALISAAAPAATANTYAEFFPDARIHLLALVPIGAPERETLRKNVRLVEAGKLDRALESLFEMPNLALIIEDGNHKKSQKLAAFRDAFLFLRPGGRYIVEDLHACHMERFRDAEGESVWDLIVRLAAWDQYPKDARPSWSRDDVELAQSIATLSIGGKVAILEKRREHYVKLREQNATQVLRRRAPDKRFSEESRAPAQKHSSRARVWNNRPELASRMPEAYDVPELRLRETDGVVCLPGQIALFEGALLPDTFRLQQRPRLQNRHLVDSSRHLSRLKTSPTPVERWEGAYLYLDSEFAGHYGHIITEVVGRLWGWRAARERNPELRVLVGAGENGELPTFTRLLLRAAGIPDESVRILERAAWIERLVTVTPEYHIGRYAAPGITSTWDALASSLAERSDDGVEKLFLTRAPGGERACHNQALVEQVFSAHGFRVVRPELLPLAQQVTLLSNARVIAGFAGSATINAIFAKSCEHKIILGSETFDPKNDYLVSAVRGGALSYFWCPADIQHPPGEWREKAFHSPFTFDATRDMASLEALLRSL